MFAKRTLKHVQAARPRAIVDLIRSAEHFRIKRAVGEAMLQPGTCDRCGYISSQPVCKACMLLEGLNRGLPRLGISKTKGGKGKYKAGANGSSQTNGAPGAETVVPAQQAQHGECGSGSIGYGVGCMGPGISNSTNGNSSTCNAEQCCAAKPTEIVGSTKGAAAEGRKGAYLASKETIVAHPSARQLQSSST